MALEGRTALVTGGGRGIGAAIAARLAAAGARVAVTGRTRVELDEVAGRIGGVAIAVDLCDRAATDRALGDVAARLGRVDVLVNNAGTAESAPLARQDDALWDRTLELNATAGFRLTRALVPAMVAAGWGRVVSIASNAGVTGYRYSAAYCAAKHAVVGYTRALAIDLAKTGVTINAVCPGWVDTKLAADAVARIVAKTGRTPEAARGELEAMTPQGRMLAPDEVAGLVAYLCDDAAAGVHGQALVIDGGQVLA
jgi:NAD(P)-dependent dehydrogenase (short-subunit alcohol dehydrogenase family)